MNIKNHDPKSCLSARSYNSDKSNMEKKREKVRQLFDLILSKVREIIPKVLRGSKKHQISINVQYLKKENKSYMIFFLVKIL